MAELLATAAITARIEEIIQKATKFIVIVSPYLRVNDRLKVLLSEKDTLSIPICVLYGKKKELRKDERTWLESMTSVTTRYCKTLHAKCYFNENEALLTSMNLYDYSQVNNREMGILVTAEKDHELYSGILEESERIRQQSEVVIRGEDHPLMAAKIDRESEEGPLLTMEQPQHGFCIRCRGDLPANPAQPYCRPCYASWRRNGKEKTSREKHCHICGSEHAATLLKPACRSCYGKYRDVLEFAA